jgi:hypothetical protein
VGNGSGNREVLAGSGIRRKYIKVVSGSRKGRGKSEVEE